MFRVIARLDIKGSRLIKGIRYEGLRVMGDAWDFAQRYYQDGADELLYIDAVASLYGRNGLNDLLTRTVANLFVRQKGPPRAGRPTPSAAANTVAAMSWSGPGASNPSAPGRSCSPL